MGQIKHKLAVCIGVGPTYAVATHSSHVQYTCRQPAALITVTQRRRPKLKRTVHCFYPSLELTVENAFLLFALSGFGTRCPTTLFRPTHCRCLWDGWGLLVWVAFLLVGRSAFPWLLLSHTACSSKESGAAAAVGMSIAICWYGGCSCRRVLAALWTAVVAPVGQLRRVVSSGTARRGFVLIFVLHSSCVYVCKRLSASFKWFTALRWH